MNNFKTPGHPFAFESQNCPIMDFQELLHIERYVNLVGT